VKNELGLRNVEVFIREKIWLENSLSQTFSRINIPTFLKPSHSSHLPAYENGTDSFPETSVYKIQKPGNYPEESIQHSDHGESLKSRMQLRFHLEHQAEISLITSQVAASVNSIMSHSCTPFMTLISRLAFVLRDSPSSGPWSPHSRGL
jgi:hypothetical protein